MRAAGLNNNSGYCFNGKYVLQLFSSYGFTSATQITVLKPSSTQSIGWASGFVLAQTSDLETDKGPRVLDYSSYAALLAFGLIALISSVGAVAWMVSRRSKSEEHRPLMENNSMGYEDITE